MSIQETRLKAIADAIREKEGSTDLIPANDFPDRIRALSSVPEGLHMINAEANAPEKGAVTGGGLASDGMTVTVTAEAMDGNVFSEWVEENKVVSEYPDYTFCVKKDRCLKAVFAHEAIQRLPTGYTEVKFIEVSGECSINTGVPVSTSTLRVVGDFKFTGDGMYIFSTDRSQSEINSYISFSMQLVKGSSGGCSINVKYGTTASTLQYFDDIDISDALQIDWDLAASKLVIGGKTYTIAKATRSMANPLNLFAATNIYATTAASGKLYSCKVYVSGALKRDFVPCINPSNIPGLYDLVEGEFYQNTLDGIVTPGPAV